jgi:hypothetical protein
MEFHLENNTIVVVCVMEMDLLATLFAHLLEKTVVAATLLLAVYGVLLLELV